MTDPSPAMHVYQSSALSDLVAAGRDHDAVLSQRALAETRRRERQSQPTPVDERTAQKQATRDKARLKNLAQQSAYREQLDALRAETGRRLLESQKRFDNRVEALQASIAAGRHGLVEETKQFLTLQHLSDRRKLERLHADWEEHVFIPLQAQVSSQLEGMSEVELSHRKRTLFEEFLAASNRKGAIFRDIVIAGDYDPLSWRSETIRVDTQRLDDPHFRLEKQERAEGQLLATPNPAAAPVPNRFSLDITQWSKLEATPAYPLKGAEDADPSNPVKPRGRKLVSGRFDRTRLVRPPMAMMGDPIPPEVAAAAAKAKQYQPPPLPYGEL
eukprot:gnl/Ergobibamus_cyprinoides/1239.p1 GENE.gnl/Ergobibamus_cyprinoides/1239~~gnl/Ergobibamus_cyprinoides/1239.p1  ORF type:complete len:329 (+),score=61.90 gnl/Ergobibamus_cyprinoides/1239:130-1116(+)